MRNVLKKLTDILLTIIGICNYYFFHKNFIYKKESFIKKYQFRKIKKLLIHCSKNVPYYKNLFLKIKFNPERDFNSLNDLTKIPVLNKETVRKNWNSFISEKSIYYLKLKTSGSTGNPLEVCVSYKHWIVEQAVIWRQWKSFNYKFRDSIAILRSFAPKENESLIKVDKLRNFIFYSPYHLSDKNMEVYYRDMIRRKIKFLRGYPSSIKIFTNFCKIRNYKLDSLKGVLFASETLNELDKIFIKDYFEVPIINHYGLAECIVMIGSIEDDCNLFNYDDYGFLELVEENGNSKIVGTNLNNFKMPLIRYDTGDFASFTKENISSHKIKMKKISDVLGRENDYITTENKKIPLINIYTTFAGYKKIIKYQIIQQNINAIKIIVLCDKKYESEISNDLYKDMYFLKNDNIKIDIEFSQNFKRLSEGKIPSFIGL